MKAKLVLISPEADAKEFKLALPTKIGRGQEAKLKLVHPLVSRVHCEIYEQDDQLMVRDMASLNGTFVNDERVADEMALPSGCRLTVGSAQFHVLYGADYDRPLPAPQAAQSDAPTTRPDETVPMTPAASTAAASAAGPDESDDPWNLAESHGNQGESREDSRTLNFDFLSDDEPPAPKAAPAPKPAAAPAAKAAAKPAAKANAPAKAAVPAKPAAAKAAPPAKPAAASGAPGRPPNPAELADDDEPVVKPFASKTAPPAKTAPAAQAPAAPADDSDEMIAGPAEESGGGDDDDLDDFFKSIM